MPLTPGTPLLPRTLRPVDCASLTQRNYIKQTHKPYAHSQPPDNNSAIVTPSKPQPRPRNFLSDAESAEPRPHSGARKRTLGLPEFAKWPRACAHFFSLCGIFCAARGIGGAAHTKTVSGQCAARIARCAPPSDASAGHRNSRTALPMSTCNDKLSNGYPCCCAPRLRLRQQGRGVTVSVHAFPNPSPNRAISQLVPLPNRGDWEGMERSRFE